MSPSVTTDATVKGNGKTPSVHVESTSQAIEYEHEFAAHNYHPLPIVMAKGEGVRVWDPEVSPSRLRPKIYSPVFK